MYVNLRTQEQIRKARRRRIIILRFLAATLALAYLASTVVFAASAVKGH